jgi:esterase
VLNYHIHGEPDNTQPPLIVLHGLLGSLDNWSTFARSQAEQRYVIAVDLRNHGDSPALTGMAYQDMAQDIREILDALAVTEYNLMGHSMGGKVAMFLALTHPAHLRRLIVVDIAPKAYPPRHQALLQAMLSMPLPTLRSRKQADEWLSAVVKHPMERGFLLKNLGRDTQGQFYWQCNLPEITRHYLKISGFPAMHTQCQVPTLCVRGALSDYVTDEDMPLIHAYFPQIQLATIANAGHLPHVQTPVEFTTLVTEFLA